jgi:Animal haem peroxidase
MADQDRLQSSASSFRLSRASRAIASCAAWLDARFGWSRLPMPLGIFTLVGIRDRLRERNLVDTGVSELDGPIPERWRQARSPDGTYNDLSRPATGAVGARFGRNIPTCDTFPEPQPRILQPSPRRVSRELLGREKLIPAEGANVLVAAWLQFEVHDWFSHGTNVAADPWRVPVDDDDPWFERPMSIRRTRPDPSYRSDSGDPPTYVSDESHWWDGSQIYGSSEEEVAHRRGADGELRVDPDGLPPADLDEAIDLAGVAGNAWLGLGLLHTLFTQEHNAIARHLRRHYRDRDEDFIFDKARLINAALMAKIHTVEWTPIVISHNTTRRAMKINWWGLAGERLTRRFGRLSSSDFISGIPGSPTADHGVPYSLTEEFVAVYRMHQLLPDDYVLRSVGDDKIIQRLQFPEIGALQTRELLRGFGMEDTLYSFGRGHPGIVCLHNYPRFLQEFHRPDGETIDLAATDVLRVRERGVPRYNEFRRLLHLKAPRTFDELTGERAWARELENVYGDVENVDMIIGSYAERLPPGFAFSDTAFRLFVLMASRRLKSDRFFTADYRPEIYTAEGLDWVNDNSLVTVLLRHYPRLEPALRGVENGFAPWNPVRP